MRILAPRAGCALSLKEVETDLVFEVMGIGALVSLAAHPERKLKGEEWRNTRCEERDVQEEEVGA